MDRGTARIDVLVVALSATLCLIAPGVEDSSAQGRAAASSVIVQEAHLSIELPPTWSRLPEKRQNEIRTICTFYRETLKGGAGEPVTPTVGIVTEQAPADQTLVQYSIAKRAQTGFVVLEVITPDSGRLGDLNGVGYLATYADKQAQPHKVYIVHAFVGKTAVQMVLDCTASAFPLVESEFGAILKSIRVQK